LPTNCRSRHDARPADGAGATARVADLADDAAYGAINLLILRNPILVNALDGSISLLCHGPGDAPSGRMLAAPGGSDTALLRISKTAEQACRGTDPG
jgi:aspartyl-tRNA(Asn)/glutamyl-tRNA(Gln) amidotransferase subunit A